MYTLFLGNPGAVDLQNVINVIEVAAFSAESPSSALKPFLQQLEPWHDTSPQFRTAVLSQKFAPIRFMSLSGSSDGALQTIHVQELFRTMTFLAGPKLVNQDFGRLPPFAV